jgi:hypothetical protein
MTFRAPISPRHADPHLEAVRRAHHEAIVEVQHALIAHPPGAGVYLGRQVFTASGQYTPASGAKACVVRMVGGGGGGGGAAGGANRAGGGGGASGEYVEFHATSSAGIAGGAVTVGAGGNSGSSAGGNGAAGGNTSITVQGTTYTAQGGPGGNGMASVASGASLGGGFTSLSAVGDVRGGEPGQPGVVISTGVWWGGNGGGCPFGYGALAVGGDSAGNSGLGYGAGGGGAASGASGHIGGFGSAGIAIVDEWG